MAQLPRLRGELVVAKNKRDVPVARLTIQGNPAEVAAHGPPQRPRGIIIAVDLTSQSLDNIREAIIDFVESKNGENMLFHIVTFHESTKLTTLPTAIHRIGPVLDDILIPARIESSQINFASLGDGLVEAAYHTMYPYPGREICTIICSDGLGPIHEAANGHRIWKHFVKQEYEMVMGARPYVAVIHTGSKAREDVLRGFLCTPNTDIYTKTNIKNKLIQQFNTACDNAHNKITVTAQYKFTRRVLLNVDGGDAAYESVAFSPMDRTDFRHVFWIPKTEVDEKNGEVGVSCNGIPLNVSLRISKNKNENNDIERQYLAQKKTDKAAGVALKKNQSFEIDSDIEHVQIEAAWQEERGKTVDVDVSATIFSLRKQFQRHVWWKEKEFPSQRDPAIVLHEDVRKGGGEGEKMDIWLKKLPQDVGFVVLSTTIYEGARGFSDIASCVVKVTNQECSPDEDPNLCFFNLAGEHSDGRACNAIIMAYFSRNSFDDTWSFNAVGQDANGKRVTEIERELKSLIRDIDA